MNDQLTWSTGTASVWAVIRRQAAAHALSTHRRSDSDSSSDNNVLNTSGYLLSTTHVKVARQRQTINPVDLPTFLFRYPHLRYQWVARQPSGQRAGLRRRRARVQIAAATLSGDSLRQTVHNHRTSVHQAAKLVAALFRVAGITAGLEESNGSLLPGL